MDVTDDDCADDDFEEDGANGAGGGLVRSALRNFIR